MEGKLKLDGKKSENGKFTIGDHVSGTPLHALHLINQTMKSNQSDDESFLEFTLLLFILRSPSRDAAKMEKQEGICREM